MSSISDIEPGRSPVAITKSDTTVYEPALRAFYVGTTGDVAILAPGAESAVTFKAVPAGAIIPVKVAKIMSTGTDASDIVGLQ